MKGAKGWRGPSTPTLSPSWGQAARSMTDPSSPPETPTSEGRKKGLRRDPFLRYARPLSRDPNIRPVGHGHQFSYQPRVAVEKLSPMSSSGDEEEEEEEEEEESIGAPSLLDAPALGPTNVDAKEEFSNEGDADADSDSDSNDGVGGGRGGPPTATRLPQPDSTTASDTEGSVGISTTFTAFECHLIIEEIDPMDSDCEGLEVLLPTEIESTRSRSRSRHKELDRGMMQDLRNLNCSNETTDNETGSGRSPGYGYDDDEEAFYRRQQELKRLRRLSMSSSFGKRTHSELSDSDNEDAGGLDVNDVGSSARHMRKRLHRGSLLFQDPPEPRIDELDEPDSSEDEFATENSLARELPYYAMEIIEVQSV
ncbi:hypothetical protein RJ55_08545 [Drechmeria coniospora]|nr:hypothetical protein RJ55_08545 [Drechmeria coniospora]